ncbi:MAG: isopentenyl-diphosphate Delta-isomerase [Halobacteriales archaeon]|nr:isopentenyl-diphosphate Delta-isomerase [Halobacteriales archaeon]
MAERVILVDEHDREVGTEEKMAAHRLPAKLHRAFSIFIFNTRGEVLLQLRSVKKHHFGGLWTNACCSHPLAGETLEQAVHRKLLQECGFDAELREVFSFTYKADWTNGLGEHEFDHVFVGTYDGPVPGNPEEADDWKWAKPEDVLRDMRAHPDNYTLWSCMAMERIMAMRKR